MSRGKKRGSWSVPELERLKRLWPMNSEDHVASVLGRSVHSVHRQALSLFPAQQKRGAWTSEDDARLRLGWGVSSVQALSRLLGRPAKEIVARADRLRRMRRKGAWKRDEQLLLKRLFGTRGHDALEVALSRSQEQIRRMAQALCLGKDKRSRLEAVRMPRWRPEEIAQLRHLYPDHDNLAIARSLRRSVQSVANKAWQLGLEKSREVLAAMGRQNIRARWG